MTDPLFTTDGDAVERALKVLREIPEYPFQDPIDRVMLRKLIEEFPTRDVPEEITKWSYWLLDHPERAKPRRDKHGKLRKPNLRSQIRNWIKDDGSRRWPNRGPAGGASATTSAHRPEAYGATSEELERW